MFYVHLLCLSYIVLFVYIVCISALVFVISTAQTQGNYSSFLTPTVVGVGDAPSV